MVEIKHAKCCMTCHHIQYDSINSLGYCPLNQQNIYEYNICPLYQTAKIYIGDV
jgi:hypothetical protein